MSLLCPRSAKERFTLRACGALLASCALALSPFAQANKIDNQDVSLGALGTISALGREGVFPAGTNGIGMSTTSCNVANIPVLWNNGDSTIPMNDDHPWISFLIMREETDRIVQISDRSYVKSGFAVAPANVCDTCSGGPFNFLNPGCSDTYSSSLNGSNFYLAAPDEIDPWLGTWSPFGTQFDRGEPPVAPPADTDGRRSLSVSMANALGPVGHRVQVSDADLNDPTASYWYGSFYVVKGEPAIARENNLASRGFDAAFQGSSWNLSATDPLLEGSILQRWTGSSLASNSNGEDDGVVYVAVKVTGPTNGLYHYEYALHNRDNLRGIGEFRIPICDGAQVLNPGFRDIDADASNDWAMTTSAGEVSYATNVTDDNPLLWNTVYNFWFDSDAEPIPSQLVSLDEYDAGAGLDTVTVKTTIPGALYNVKLGDGCSFGTPPTLTATGTPARATIGNATFGLESAGNVANELNLLFFTTTDGQFTLGNGCDVFLDLAGDVIMRGSTTADGTGLASYAVPVPNQPSLEGVDINFQATGVNPGGGPAFNFFELSDGLQVRIGDSIPDCP